MFTDNVSAAVGQSSVDSLPVFGCNNPVSGDLEVLYPVLQLNVLGNKTLSLLSF